MFYPPEIFPSCPNINWGFSLEGRGGLILTKCSGLLLIVSYCGWENRLPETLRFQWSNWKYLPFLIMGTLDKLYNLAMPYLWHQ